MDEQRRLGDKWREGDVEVARSLAVPVGQDKVPSLKCSVTSTPLQGSRQRPLSAPLRGSLHKAPGFAGGYLRGSAASIRAIRSASGPHAGVAIFIAMGALSVDHQGKIRVRRRAP
jgi:hypothetical protein